MSRIGKNPITIPEGVTVSLNEGVVTVKGKLGELTQEIPIIYAFPKKLVIIAELASALRKITPFKSHVYIIFLTFF